MTVVGRAPEPPDGAPRGVWDCVVVGAGPAGLSAAVYMGRFRRRTLVIDDGEGRWSYGQHNDNYLGFPGGVSARRLQKLGTAQAQRFGVAFRCATVTRVEPVRWGYTVETARGRHAARTLIWAAGVQDLWPDFEGARGLVGRRLFWCIVCDGWRALERQVLVLGNDDKAARTTLQFRTYTRRITLLVEPERARLSGRARDKLVDAGIRVLHGRARAAREQDDGVLVRLEDGSTLRPDLLFSLLGSRPRLQPLEAVPVERARNGHLRIDDKNRTNLPTFFAAGDVTNKHSHQVASAVHEGAQAAQAANHALYPPFQRLEPGR